MSKIKEIKARQILDSRGNPTVEADVILSDGSFGRAAVPSGSSLVEYEAIELRDGNPDLFNGKSVLQAIKNIKEEIFPLLLNKDAKNQQKIDDYMIRLDGTSNKSNLGANAILAVSLATSVAAANSMKLELYEYLNLFSPKKLTNYVLPYPLINIINGGNHASNSSDFQEYIIVPLDKNTFAERLRKSVEVFQCLKSILEREKLDTHLGDEGGFALNLGSNSSQLGYIIQAIEKAGYIPGKDFSIALDVAAGNFFDEGKYSLISEQKIFPRSEMINYYESLVADYPIISLEDPLEQNDFTGWAQLTKKLGSKIQIVGDDLYATNTKRLQTGIDSKASNSILIKPNQIGTLSETIEAIDLAYKNNMSVVISHRSGETEDTFIADLAVAMRANQIKAGSVCRSERLAKYNRLLRIEERILEKGIRIK